MNANQEIVNLQRENEELKSKVKTLENKIEGIDAGLKFTISSIKQLIPEFAHAFDERFPQNTL